jgi:PTS system mannose-specific IID component
LARESRYFNAHPYLASVAVGALARAELDGESPERIERFRTALCGTLGSVGDRLVWAGWLPFCSLASLALFGLGARTLSVVGFFLVAYNVGHFALRIWGLNTGWTHGLRVASALGNPVLRRGRSRLADWRRSPPASQFRSRWVASSVQVAI